MPKAEKKEKQVFKEYEVLSRRLRPRLWSEVIGQVAAVRSMSNALKSGKIPHALLFIGDRGMGKTTMARLIAARVNCENPTEGSPEPCGVCASCQGILSGRNNMVVQEIDCGTTNKVDDIKELVNFSEYSSGDQMRIFILDEFHHVTVQAKTALLKSIEEPNSNVMWILCTTELHKVPETIQSRCVVLRVSPVDYTTMKNYLVYIVEGLIERRECEFTEFDEDALGTIADLSDGSVRQALSLLEQVVAYGGERLSSAIVQMVSGRPSVSRLADFVKAIVEGNLQLADKVIREVYSDDFSDSLMDYLYREFMPRTSVASISRRKVTLMIRSILDYQPRYSTAVNRDGLLFTLWDAVNTIQEDTAVKPVEKVTQPKPALTEEEKAKKRSDKVKSVLKLIRDCSPTEYPAEMVSKWDGSSAVVCIGKNRLNLVIAASEEAMGDADMVLPFGSVSDIIKAGKFSLKELFEKVKR